MSTLKNLASLEWEDGKANPSGIKPIAYMIRKSQIAGWPKMPISDATAESQVVYDGDFTPAAGAVFATIYSTPGKGKISFESVGETDCKGFTHKASLSYPDLNVNAKATATATVNANVVVVIPHLTAGGIVKYVVLGNENIPARISYKGDTGDSFGSAKGLTIELEADDYVAMPEYEGLLETSEGTLNCKTGVFTHTGSTPTPPDSGEGA